MSPRPAGQTNLLSRTISLAIGYKFHIKLKTLEFLLLKIRGTTQYFCRVCLMKDLKAAVGSRHGLADRQICFSLLSSPLTDKWRHFLQEQCHFSFSLGARGGVLCKKSPACSMTQLTSSTRPLCRSANSVVPGHACMSTAQKKE